MVTVEVAGSFQQWCVDEGMVSRGLPNLTGRLLSNLNQDRVPYMRRGASIRIMPGMGMWMKV